MTKCSDSPDVKAQALSVRRRALGDGALDKLFGTPQIFFKIILPIPLQQLKLQVLQRFLICHLQERTGTVMQRCLCEMGNL
jgi:hypothetical protein